MAVDCLQANLYGNTCHQLFSQLLRTPTVHQFSCEKTGLEIDTGDPGRPLRLQQLTHWSIVNVSPMASCFGRLR